MRTTALALVLFLAASLSLSAGESMRLNFVKGLYSVTVPANWYIDVDTGDSTLSIAQGPDAASPRVIIAIPNPAMAARLNDYATLAANSFLSALGGGQIVENKDNDQGHGVLFRSTVSGTNFVGAVQTQRHGNYAILTVFLTRESDYARTKDWAAIVLDSLRINDSALSQQTAFVSGQADNLVRDLQRYQNRTAQGGSASGTTLPDRTGADSRQSRGGAANDPGSLWGQILGGAAGGQGGDAAGTLGSILGSILGEGGDDDGIATRDQASRNQGGQNQGRTTREPAPWGSSRNSGNESGYGNLLNNPFSGLTR